MWLVSGTRRLAQQRRESRRRAHGAGSAASGAGRRSRAGGTGDAAVEPAGVLVPARAQRAGHVLELAVADEPLEQPLGGLARVELLELLLDVVLEQQARLHLEQRRHEHDELRGGVEVELAAVGEPQDVLGDDARDAHLPDVDLVLEDERDEEVERPVEDVEVEIEAPRAVRRRRAASARIAATSLPHQAVYSSG